jgi:hypothetical protein
MNTEPFEILTGVGDLYIAPLSTAFPAVNAVPGASWRHLGYTQDGVTIKKTQKINQVMVDQETGPVKASRSEETLTVETTLAEMTLSNLADYLGGTVTTTAAGSGVIGEKEIGLYAGADVKNFAILFRGKSAYGDYPAQYEIPVAYFDGDVEMKADKSDNTKLKVVFQALVDQNAVSASEKFGRLVMQTAEATA